MFGRIASASLLLLLTLTACKDMPVNRDQSRELTTVSAVDLDRYTGRWYEIARVPNSFEEGCVAVTATYSKNPDGTVRVINRCHLLTLTGKESVAVGSARIVDSKTNAKLAVTFFWPFEGDYWILSLADDYSWVLVGEPSGKYLWILARSPRISDGLRADLVTRLNAIGYNAKALYWTPQP
ncbi:MAG: lipocalin family protein [Micropepsaceae bacterium]